MVRGKKAILQIAALAMSAMMAFGFAACGEKEHQHADADGDGYCDTDGTWIGEGEDPALHEHTYDTTKWAYDSTYHYHAGTCGHDVLKDRERHSFNGDEAKCTVCDYERSFDDIYQMYLGGQILSLRGAGYQVLQVGAIKNWSEYAEKAYKLDYDETTKSWKTKESIQIGLADEVVVINTIRHTQYGFNNGSSQYGVTVDKAGKYFVSLKFGEITPVLTRDYGDHTHTYDAWGYDADNHWKQCAEDGEKDPATVAPHAFGDDGHCTQDGCGAVSQEKCKHEKGFTYNYTALTLPSATQASSGQLAKVCPDCGKKQEVPVAQGVAWPKSSPTQLNPIEGYYYQTSRVQGYFAFGEPGTYTLQVAEAVFDDGKGLTLTAITVGTTGSKQYSGSWVPEAGLGVARNESPSYTETSVYDYAKTDGWTADGKLSPWRDKIQINGKPASAWTDKWATFTSITVTVTQDDIDAVPQQYIKATEEGKEDTPVPKYVYVSFNAVAKQEQETTTSNNVQGAWLYTVTEPADCDHKTVTYTKEDAETAFKNGTEIKGTCSECSEEVTTTYDEKIASMSTRTVKASEIGKTYYINGSGYMGFKIEQAGTYTFTKQIVYRVPDVVDDKPDDETDTSKTYLNFFRDVYITTGASAGKAAANAIYADGAWKDTDLAKKWFSKIKFDENVGGTGYTTKTETLTFTITVAEEDLQNLGDGNSLFVTLGVWFGEKSASWSGAQTGSYFLVSMQKEATPTAATVSAQEVALPVKQDN